MLLDTLVILPISVIAFAILLMFIVFFHEFGHFSMARLLGVRVDTFSIGFGKPLLAWTDRKGTEWRIAMIPLGGYVKFFGDLNAASQPDPGLRDDDQNDDGSSEDSEGPKPVTTQFPTADRNKLASDMTAEERAVCFHFKPVWARALVVAAGPMANFILAIVIFTSLLSIFGRYVTPPVVGTVVADSAAQEAGLMPGDRVLSINGKKIDRWRDMHSRVMLSTGEPLDLIVQRDGGQVTITVTPRRQVVEDSFGNKQSFGVMGIQSASGVTEAVRYSVPAALQAAVGEVWRIVSTTVRFLGRLVQGKESAKELGGPVKMAKYAGQAAWSGFGDNIRPDVSFGDRLIVSLTNFINLAAFISVSIGFLNLLPIPVLDGGHLVYYAIEAVAGKPLGPRVQAIGYQIGLVILVSFMVFVTWNDITGLLLSTFSTSG